MLQEFAFDLRLAAEASRALMSGVRRVDTDDVVSQPRFDMQGFNFGHVIGDALRPRAKLKPTKKRSAVVTAAGSNDPVRVVVMVQAAEALPVRADAAALLGQQAGAYLGPGVDEAALLSPFVEVLFGDTAVRTQTQIGAYTSFNEVRMACQVPSRRH